MGARRDPRYDDAVKVYESGCSIEECAELYGITRQAMHKILTRRGAEMRDQLRYGEDNHFYRGGVRASDRVHNLVENAIGRGQIVRQPCEVCGADGKAADGRSIVQAHHDDYSKPLDIRWLCQPCHHEWHRHNVAKGETEGTRKEAATVVSGGFP